jgi:hypothetical protein
LAADGLLAHEGFAFMNGSICPWIQDLNRLSGGGETLESGAWLEEGHWGYDLGGYLSFSC